MLHFTKVLHVEDRGFLYFSFKCMNTHENNKCQVQVWTEGQQCHDFVMEEQYGNWKMSNASLAPHWIRKLETQLETVICEYQLRSPALPSKFRLPENLAPTGS